MIVNSAYMYMVSAVEKVIKLFDKGKTPYTFKVTQGTATLDVLGLTMRGFAICTFAGVDLTGRTKVAVTWINKNYPQAGNFFLYIEDANGKQLKAEGFNKYDEAAEIFEMTIPPLGQIENATIKFATQSFSLFSSCEIS